MATSARRLRFRMVLLFTFLASLVLLNGVSLERTPSRSRRGLPWDDTPYDTEDDMLYDRLQYAARNSRQGGNKTFSTTTIDPPLPETTETTDPTPLVTDPLPSPTTDQPPPPTTDEPPPPVTNPPPDNCGTNFVSATGFNDPGPCFIDPLGIVNPITCPDTGEICMKDLSRSFLYTCRWTSGSTSSKRSITLPIIEEVPGHCDPDNPPAIFANSTIPPSHVCQIKPIPIVPQNTKCVCSKWDGSCPPEELKTCELANLRLLADEMIAKIEESSELVQQDCECDFELEKKLPMAMEELKAGKNLYRVVMLLWDARNKHICNRRRLMACLPDGKCGCAPGTARRTTEKGGITYQSYFCYAIEGQCDRDPGQVIDQFESTRTKLYTHYGDPAKPEHLNKTSGCFFNLCKNAEDVIGKTCEDRNVDF